MNKWTQEDLEILYRYYSRMGKMWCATALGRSEASIRQKTYELGLRLDHDSEFFKDFQRRAAEKKIGVKRPEQALVIKRLHEEGRLKKTQKQKDAASVLMKKWHSENAHPRGMLGKKHSNESLKKMSSASKKNFENMSEDAKFEKVKKMVKTKIEKGNLVQNRYKTTWKAAWREIGGKRKFFRSRWEANYAYYLQWLKERGQIIEWEHEPKTFWFEGVKRGTVSYLPDFRVTENDGSEAFHEVKGWMDDRSKTKIKRMAKYYPNVKLIVIDSKAYASLKRTASSMIPGWEN